MARFHRKDVRRRAGRLASGGVLLLGLAFVAGVATPARAEGCKGVPEPDQKKIDQLRETGRYDALERMLAGYQRAYHRDPSCEPALWDAFGDNRDWKESDRGGFDRWVAARPDAWVALTASGLVWEHLAYARRGNATWSKTPAAGRKGFQDAMQRARAELRRAIAQEPRDIVAAGVMLEVLKGYGDTNGALAVYRAALAADPMTKAVRVRMLWAAEPEWGGSVALMQQVVAEARAHEDRNPRLKEVEPFFYSWAGYAACTQGKYAVAVRAYRKALRVMPDQAGWRYWLAWALQRQGDEAGALGELTKALADAPDDADAWALRSTVHRKLGDGRAALADAEKAVQLAPRSADAWSARASANVQLRQWEPAKEAYAKVAALADDPETQTWALQQRSRLVAEHPAGAGREDAPAAVEGVVQHFIALTEEPASAEAAKSAKPTPEKLQDGASPPAPAPAAPRP